MTMPRRSSHFLMIERIDISAARSFARINALSELPLQPAGEYDDDAKRVKQQRRSNETRVVPLNRLVRRLACRTLHAGQGLWRRRQPRDRRRWRDDRWIPALGARFRGGRLSRATDYRHGRRDHSAGGAQRRAAAAAALIASARRS